MTISKMVMLNGVRLHYVEQAGPAVVVLHGLSGSHAEFLHLLPELERQAHVYLLDLRGHGCSGWTADGYRLADYCRDAAAFLQQVVGRPAIVVGHSLGGFVAVWLAAHAPHLLQAVLLSDSNVYITQIPHLVESGLYAYFSDLHDYLGRYRANGAVLEELVAYIGALPAGKGQTRLEADGPEVVYERAVQLHQMDPAILEPLLAADLWGAEKPDEVLAQVRCPVHLVVADSGVFAEPELRRVLSLIPQASYAVIPDAGHDIHLDQPEAFLQELKRFLAAVGQPVG